ncbi:hypothetical protein ACWKWU_08935 [Chitinophaga lutea]
MKHLHLLAIVCILAACQPNTSQTTVSKEEHLDSNNIKPISVQPITGYFVKNTVKQSDSVTCWVINTPAQRDSILGIARTMDKPVDSIDFAQSIGVAITLQPGNEAHKITLTEAVQENDVVDLHFAILRDTTKLGYKLTPVWLGTVPRTYGVKTIRFFDAKGLLRTVAVQE